MKIFFQTIYSEISSTFCYSLGMKGRRARMPLIWQLELLIEQTNKKLQKQNMRFKFTETFTCTFLALLGTVFFWGSLFSTLWLPVLSFSKLSSFLVSIFTLNLRVWNGVITSPSLQFNASLGNINAELSTAWKPAGS